MKAICAKYLVLILAASLLLAPFPAQASAEVKSTFLYNLSNFHGKMPYNDVRVRVDRARDEVYVVDRGIVRVFNETGMELFWFGDDPELTAIYDLAVDEKGDIFLLSYDFTDLETRNISSIRCNYRGEAKRNSRFRDSPWNSPGSSPITCFTGTVTSSSSAAADDGRRDGSERGLPEGVQPRRHPRDSREGPAGHRDLRFQPGSRGEHALHRAGPLQGIRGFPGRETGGVFREGRLRARTVRHRERHRRDDQGNYLVVERLRSVVMVFDKEFRFLKEFGYRGDKPGNLIRPNELAMGNAGKLYVTQLRNRGVSVFSITSD